MPRTRLAFSVAAALLLVASATFAADGPGDDQVRLKNGGMVRGAVVEWQPNVTVKILVAGEKEPRVIPWADVAGVDMGNFTPVAAPAPAPLPAPPPTVVVVPAPVTPPMEPPGIHVHIDSPVPVVLHSNTDTTGMVATFGPHGGVGAVTLHTAHPLCSSPCDESIDVRHDVNLSVGADGVTESGRFSLAGRTGDVELKVSPGSSSAYYGGAVMTGLGAAAVLTGVLFVALGPDLNTPTIGGATGSNSGDDFVTAGIVTASVGGGLLVGGIIAIVSGRTTVEIEGGTPVQTARAPRYWAGEF